MSFYLSICPFDFWYAIEPSWCYSEHRVKPFRKTFLKL